ncbi:MAG: tetratricopeptide repeat protein [Actinomycetaceae bacterium]|nr:tetratricopeptide repeat protein [Arcanobacterium sp.]MDD7504542.1 tetratricopeptide repeat protein [Actinomycetaceae bacterium]MDY6143185.1 tetratricopeptide repeat protein [Arcanobacterium sp.]
MLDEETMLRTKVDDLESQGRYYDMVAPLEELVAMLSVRCSGGGCHTARETPEYAAALDRLGGLHRNLGNLDRAYDIYQEAVRTSATVFGTNDPNYATTLNNYAGLQRLRKEYDQAANGYQKAEGIYNDTLGPNHVLTVSCLNNRGLLFQDQNMLSEALQLHEEALRRLQSEAGNEVAQATTLNNLASVYAKMKRYDEARTYMEQASAIYEKTVGKSSDLYLGQIHNLASMQALSGDYQGALERFEWVAQRCREMFGPRSDNLVAVLRNLDAVYQRLGMPERAAAARSELEGIQAKG